MTKKKYAILGDVHGNWEALSVVLRDAEELGVDSYVCVGDVVGYNVDPARCLNKIREIGCTVVRGNHDHYCSHEECLEDFHPLAARVVDWTRNQLDDDGIEFLRNMRLSTKVDGFTIVHSTLDMPEKWGYVFDCLEADANFNYQSTSVCFHGHTHVPVAYVKRGMTDRIEYGKIRIVLGQKYFINVGSVGQPRDGNPRAAYAFYDAEKREVELRRLEYDIRATQEKIREAGLPERLARRLQIGK